MSVHILFVVLLLQHSVVLYGRNDLQSETKKIVVSTESDLQSAVENLEPGQQLQLDFESLQLEKTLVINVGGVELEGREGGSKIKCPEYGDGLHLKKSAVLKNLHFEGCSGSSAVAIEPPEGTNVSSVSILFQKVRFSRNSRDYPWWKGPSLHVSACSYPPCSGPKIAVEFRESECFDNAADTGGGIYCRHCDLSIIDSQFRSNTAVTLGAAIYIEGGNSSLNITSSTFENNRQEEAGPQTEVEQRHGLPLEAQTYFRFKFPSGSGGAIATSSVLSITIHNSTFRNNRGAAGGALSILYTTSITQTEADNKFSCEITSCLFQTNQAVNSDSEHDSLEENSLGGAIYLVSNAIDLRWRLSNVQFIRNKARYGGGLHMVTLSLTEPKISQCLFEENDASGNGGGILARNTGGIELEESNFTRNSAAFGGAIMLTNGAMLTCQGLRGIDPNQRTGSPNRFIDNSATDGGGVMCVACRNVIFVDDKFVNNSAKRFGGGVYFFNTQSKVTIRQGYFRNNRALIGGGAAFEAVGDILISSEFESLDTVFSENSAASGAGVFVKENRYQQNRLRISRTTFKDNFALNSNNTNSFDSVPKNFVRRKSCGDGHGGGVCLLLNDIPEDSKTDVKLLDSRFTGNKGAVGAGMFVELANESWNEENLSRSPHSMPYRKVCRIFFLINLKFETNEADFGGGAMFASHPEKVLVSCEESLAADHSPLNAVFDSPKNICLDFQDNVVMDSNGTYGPNIASRVYSLSILHPLNPIEGLKGGTRILPPCEGCPENRTEGIIVVIKDAFNQTITGGIADSRFRVQLFCRNILGERVYQAEHGVININNTIGIGVRTEDVVEIHLDENPNIKVNLAFSTRDCYPGEIKLGNECVPCKASTYSFNSKVICKECSSMADCHGRASLVPHDGYWHSSPFSTQFHKCIIEDACIFDNRTEQLAAYYDNITRVSSDLALLEGGTGPRDFENYTQCAEGYRGVLCGSCDAGYGHVSGGECMQCPDGRGRAFLHIVTNTIWLLLYIFVMEVYPAIHSASLQLEQRRQTASRPAHSNETVDSNSLEDSLLEDHAARSSNGRQETLLEDEQQDVHIPSTSSEPEIERKLEAATEKFSETSKILTNYCQVTGVALSVDFSWPQSLLLFLYIPGSISSDTDGLLHIPLDCSLNQKETDPRIPYAIQTLWIRTAFPVMLLVFFSLLVPIYSYAHIRVRKLSRTASNANIIFSRRHMTYFIATALVLLHYSYIDLTYEFMRAINCIKVDTKDEGVMEYQQYSIASGRKFWAEDTNLRCFQGKHTVAGVIGILGLILFSFLVVILLAIRIGRKTKETDRNPLFIARYGFLCQGYDSRRASSRTWELWVFFRKALVAAIMIYAFNLGVNLQVALLLGVLILALLAQYIVQPFKTYDARIVPNMPSFRQVGHVSTWVKFHNNISLNSLESASLASTIMIFYSGIVLNDDNTSEAGKSVLAAVSLAINVTFVAYIVFRFYAAAVIILDLRLEYYGMTTDERQGRMNVLRFAKDNVRLYRHIWSGNRNSNH